MTLTVEEYVKRCAVVRLSELYRALALTGGCSGKTSW